RKVTEKALNLSLKYHFVTPLTSLVVTRPEEEANKQLVANKPKEDYDIPGSHAAVSNTQIADSHYYVDYDAFQEEEDYVHHSVQIPVMLALVPPMLLPAPTKGTLTCSIQSWHGQLYTRNAFCLLGLPHTFHAIRLVNANSKDDVQTTIML
ncbi:unnamed protein product, partial [Staurois parvus]